MACSKPPGGCPATGRDGIYAYDTAGRRVQQTVNGADTNYLWDETSRYGDVVLETDGGGAPLVSYRLVSGRLLSQHRGGVDSYYLHDAQGSTRALVDSAGTVTDTYRYAAFGDIYAQTGTTLNSYLYTGQQHDNLTGLYSLRARYYEPRLGRFLSRDPYPVNYRNPIEYNRYMYAANSPVRYSDPTGLSLVGRALQRVSVTVPVLLIALTFGAALLNTYILIKDSLAFELPWSLSGGGAGTGTEEEDSTGDGAWCPSPLCPDSSGEQEQSSDPNVPGLQDGQAPTSDDFLPNVDDLPDDPSPSLTLPSVGNPAGTNYPVPDPERAAGQLVFWVAVSFTTAAIIGISLLPGSGSGTTSPPTPQPTATPSCPSYLGGGRHPNIPGISYSYLVSCRPEVVQTFTDIRSNGPFLYPNKDDQPFQNRPDPKYQNTRPLPVIQPPDQYREYTVITPSLSRRGQRRIVTLGDQNRQSSQYYQYSLLYTDDHYEHFFVVIGAPYP